ncbi:MAG TPA: hypothetical protein VMG60_15065 [Burkholderiaceae bacterium]|nr:hypothetical protein [Burkholderiaceae bacterium]
MSDRKDGIALARWANNLAEVDCEIARLALLGRVRFLDAGVLKRVLQQDASVCGADNPAAFTKLRALLMTHLALRTRSAEEVGVLETAAIEAAVAERLTLSFPDALGHWPPG